MAADHHPEQPDCTSCHMPRLDSADVSHTEVTDHRIVRFAGLKGSIATAGETLTQFGNATPDPRDLGLAYGELALRGNTFAANESFRLLNQAIASHPDDADVLTRLGYFYQVQGDADRAQRLYERALEHDPDLAVVAGNLGVIYAARGKLMEALALWRNAFEKNPQLTELALNLGTGLCHAGDGPGARQVVRRALEHNPDSAAARQLLSSITDAACVRRE
jgi:Flp pilus assembly protein TadD